MCVVSLGFSLPGAECNNRFNGCALHLCAASNPQCEPCLSPDDGLSDGTVGQSFTCFSCSRQKKQVDISQSDRQQVYMSASVPGEQLLTGQEQSGNLLKGAKEAGQDALDGKTKNPSETDSWEAFIVQGFTMGCDVSSNSGTAEPSLPANSGLNCWEGRMDHNTGSEPGMKECRNIKILCDLWICR